MTHQNRHSAGMNGFGRFGMHLLQYWIQNYSEANFDITHINDEVLRIADIQKIIEGDAYLTLKHHLTFDNNDLLVTIDGKQHRITYTNEPLEKLSWLGQVELFFECSGKHTSKSDWKEVLTGKTAQVVISATSWTADQILVYGYNHHDFQTGDSQVVSYGSCTVNAYIPLAQWLHNKWGVADSDVNVIHNVPVHQHAQFNTLERRSCTLEQVAPHLLPFLSSDNFAVNYTLVPYTGVSIIDMRFRLTAAVTESVLTDELAKAIEHGELKGLYAVVQDDNGPEEHKFTKYSAVLPASRVYLKGQSLYIGGYFDNENSVNRYFDIANYISNSINHDQNT